MLAANESSRGRVLLEKRRGTFTPFAEPCNNASSLIKEEDGMAFLALDGKTTHVVTRKKMGIDVVPLQNGGMKICFVFLLETYTF